MASRLLSSRALKSLNHIKAMAMAMSSANSQILTPKTLTPTRTQPPSLLRPFSSSSSSSDNDNIIISSYSFTNPYPRPGDFEWHESDLDSDDKMWKLYERWIAFHDLHRPSGLEKTERFKIFKESARHIVRQNKLRTKPWLACYGLNQFSDSDPDKGYPMFPSLRDEEEEGEEQEDEKPLLESACELLFQRSFMELQEEEEEDRHQHNLMEFLRRHITDVTIENDEDGQQHVTYVYSLTDYGDNCCGGKDPMNCYFDD